jgi:nucleoid-associated protein YgaU
MVANWVKALWILLGGTVAAAGAAYVTGVFEPSPGSPRVEAAVQQPPADQSGAAREPAQTGDATADMPADGGKAEGAEQQVASLPSDSRSGGVDAQDATAEPELVVPAFDLVRVESDGSVVIAGIAAPRSAVEVIAGATVIGTATAGAGGDFAVVLDDPLKPGDYTVVLRSTGEDNVVASSAQTAVISVPETESGQVLALVEEPGAPSRLITVPKAAETAPKADRPAAAEETVAAAPSEEPKPDIQANNRPETPDTAAKPETQAAAPEASETEGAEEMAAAGEEPAAAEEQAAAVTQAEPEKPAPAVSAAAPRVAVEAVEIEGRKVFVAGFAEVGSTVRVYANDILLGQAAASEAGRFLIEAEKDLPVGDYIVRADMLSADNAEVVARAAVPFEREPGERLAAVAAQPAETVESAVQQPKEQGAAEETAVVDEDDAGQMAAKETAVEDPAGEEMASSKAGQEEAMSGEKAAGDTSMQADDEKPAQVAALEGTEAPETTAPKLQNVGGSVIIRRGDTLWRLSRRVYGRGVRYTTIYLANQGQITDPDMIWPGQVFSVPGETDEGETADMSAVAEQVAEPGETSEDVVTR